MRTCSVRRSPRTNLPHCSRLEVRWLLERWKSYALDLSDTEWYDSLTDKSLAISDDDGVFSIPYTVEGYGVITNKRIIEDYCAMDGAVIESIDDINNFDTLKAVAEDI